MRVPTFQTEAECINYHMAIYYQRVGENPEVRIELKSHIQLVEEVNKRYEKALSQSVLDWDNYHGSFKQNVNYLTGVLDKQAKQQEMKDRKKALMDKHT